MARFPTAKPLNVDDFSGGITDQVVSNDITKAEEMDNFNITDNRKLKSREGLEILTAGILPAADANSDSIVETPRRVGGLKEFKENSTLVVQSGSKVYANDGTTWTELQGPNAKDGLPQATEDLTADLSASEWRGHMFITNDGDTQPAKIYKDENDTLQLVGAGLPEVADNDNFTSVATTLAQAIALANEIKADFNAHGVLTPKHAVAISGGNLVTSPDATDLASLVTLSDEIKTDWTAHYGDSIAPVPSNHRVDDTEANDATFPVLTAPGSLTTPIDLLTCVQLLLEIKRDYNVHDNRQAEVLSSNNSVQLAVHQADAINPVTSRLSLLDEAIFLANEIRSRLKGHLAEATFLHSAADTVADGLIGAAATDQATLLTLTGEMLDAYSSHFNDVTTNKTLHEGLRYDDSTKDKQIQSSEEDQTLIIRSTPTTLKEAADALDELKLRYNVHEVDTLSHRLRSNVSSPPANLVTAAYLRASSGPQSGPSVDAMADYAQGIANVFLQHLNETLVSGTAHTGASAPDSLNQPKLVKAEDEISLSDYIEDLFLKYSSDGTADVAVSHLADITSGPTIHTAGGTDHSTSESVLIGAQPRYAGGIVPGNFTQAIDRLNDIKSNLNNHLADSTAHAVALIERLSGEDLTVATRSYAFHYFREYKVGADVTFQDFGPVLTKVFDNTADPKFSPIVISDIVALTEGDRDNLDLTNMKLRIYRTVANGNTFFKVGEIAVTDTSFTDRTDDENLILQETLYTTGGVLSNDRPPESKYLHIVNDYAYYANITLNGEGSEGEDIAIPHRILQAKAADPDSAPRGNFVDLDEPVVGISSYGDRPIAFTASSIFRLDGTFNEIGSGFISAVKIADDIGLASNRSLVRIDKGLLFAGAKDGFYITDGERVRKISDFETRYQALVNKNKIVGLYNESERRVEWAAQKESGSVDNDQAFVLHLNQPMEERSASFTTYSGGASYAPCALGYLADQVIVANPNGYLLAHDSSFRTDAIVDVTTDPADWDLQTIVYNYKGVATNFGMPNQRKWVPYMNMKTKRNSRLSLLPRSINDLGAKTTDMAPITVKGPEFIWNEALTSDYEFVWGDDDFIWNFKLGSVGTNKRRFTSPQMRCDNKQIQFTNDRALILSSDSSQTATIDSAAKTLTLAAAPPIPWPKEFVGYVIAFSVDGFVTEFPITGIDATQLVLSYSDTTDQTVQNYPTSGLTSWVVRGEPKAEILELISYSLYYVQFSNSQFQFQGSPQGGSFDAQTS